MTNTEKTIAKTYTDTDVDTMPRAMASGVQRRKPDPAKVQYNTRNTPRTDKVYGHATKHGEADPDINEHIDTLNNVCICI